MRQFIGVTVGGVGVGGAGSLRAPLIRCLRILRGWKEFLNQILEFMNVEIFLGTRLHSAYNAPFLLGCPLRGGNDGVLSKKTNTFSASTYLSEIKRRRSGSHMAIQHLNNAFHVCPTILGNGVHLGTHENQLVPSPPMMLVDGFHVLSSGVH